MIITSNLSVEPGQAHIGNHERTSVSESLTDPSRVGYCSEH